MLQGPVSPDKLPKGWASTEPRDTFNQFFIGQDLGGGTYTGSLDQIQIYDSALSGGQIAALAAIPEPSTYARSLARLNRALRRIRAQP